MQNNLMCEVALVDAVEKNIHFEPPEEGNEVHGSVLINGLLSTLRDLDLATSARKLYDALLQTEPSAEFAIDHVRYVVGAARLVVDKLATHFEGDISCPVECSDCDSYYADKSDAERDNFDSWCGCSNYRRLDEWKGDKRPLPGWWDGSGRTRQEESIRSFADEALPLLLRTQRTESAVSSLLVTFKNSIANTMKQLEVNVIRKEEQIMKCAKWHSARLEEKKLEWGGAKLWISKIIQGEGVAKLLMSKITKEDYAYPQYFDRETVQDLQMALMAGEASARNSLSVLGTMKYRDPLDDAQEGWYWNLWKVFGV